MRIRFGVLLGLLITQIGQMGCSHYYLPSSQLASPESGGAKQALVLSPLRLQSGTDLGPVTTKAQAAYAKYALGLEIPTAIGGNEKWDLGIRVQPFAPLVGLAKVQLAGQPHANHVTKEWKWAIQGGPGYLLSNGVSFISFELGSPVGYRLTRSQLISTTPFVSTGSVSGLSATQYGISLGYEYELESMQFRSELQKISGSFGSAQISQYGIGILLGLSLERTTK